MCIWCFDLLINFALNYYFKWCIQTSSTPADASVSQLCVLQVFVRAVQGAMQKLVLADISWCKTIKPECTISFPLIDCFAIFTIWSVLQYWVTPGLLAN